MRILLDENVPVDLASELPGHQVATVVGLGWAGIKNGELLRRSAEQFDALLTMDTKIPRQQNISAFDVRVVLIHAHSNRMIHLRPLIPAILEALSQLKAGELRHVGASGYSHGQIG